MNTFLTYLFYPNPGNADYTSPKALAAIIICIVLMLAALGLSYWRKNMASGPMRKISKSWASAAFWFGLTGAILVVSRIEEIQFISMRFIWVLWTAALVWYIVWQFRNYRLRYYEVLPSTPIIDPRSKYLPKKKKR